VPSPPNHRPPRLSHPFVVWMALVLILGGSIAIEVAINQPFVSVGGLILALVLALGAALRRAQLRGDFDPSANRGDDPL